MTKHPTLADMMAALEEGLNDERPEQERRMQAFREALVLSKSIPSDNPLVTMSDEEIKEMLRNRGQ